MKDADGGELFPATSESVLPAVCQRVAAASAVLVAGSSQLSELSLTQQKLLLLLQRPWEAQHSTAQHSSAPSTVQASTGSCCFCCTLSILVYIRLLLFIASQNPTIFFCLTLRDTFVLEGVALEDVLVSRGQTGNWQVHKQAWAQQSRHFLTHSLYIKESVMSRLRHCRCCSCREMIYLRV